MLGFLKGKQRDTNHIGLPQFDTYPYFGESATFYLQTASAGHALIAPGPEVAGSTPMGPFRDGCNSLPEWIGQTNWAFYFPPKWSSHKVSKV